MCLFVSLLILPLHCSLSQCLTIAMTTVIIYYKSLSSRLFCHIHGGIINPSPTFMLLPHSNIFSSPLVPAEQSHNSLAWHSRPFIIGTHLPFTVLFLSTPFSRPQSSNHLLFLKHALYFIVCIFAPIVPYVLEYILLTGIMSKSLFRKSFSL